jgi:hypothetical protein
MLDYVDKGTVKTYLLRGIPKEFIRDMTNKKLKKRLLKTLRAYGKAQMNCRAANNYHKMNIGMIHYLRFKLIQELKKWNPSNIS